MAEGILKFALKKEVFEGVADGASELYFETSGFYMSRFTTSKHNTIEMLKENQDLFRTFDKVEISCGGNTIVRDVVSVGLTDEDVPQFKMVIKPAIEIRKPEPEDIVLGDESLEDGGVMPYPGDENVSTWWDKIKETDREVSLPDVEKPVDDGETKPDVAKSPEHLTFETFLEKENVYSVKNSRVTVTYMGKIYGCDKRLPAKNEHDYVYTLEPIEFATADMDKVLTELAASNKYVFVAPTSLMFDTPGQRVQLYVKVISKLEVINML